MPQRTCNLPAYLSRATKCTFATAILASLLNKYDIKHVIPGFPPPAIPHKKSTLITTVGQTQNLHSNMIGDTPFSSIEFPYVRWDQFLKIYMDDLIFGVPKQQDGANTLMLIITILVLYDSLIS